MTDVPENLPASGLQLGNAGNAYQRHGTPEFVREDVDNAPDAR